MALNEESKDRRTGAIRPRVNTGASHPSIPVQDFDGRENRGAGDSGNTPDTRIDTPQIIRYGRC